MDRKAIWKELLWKGERRRGFRATLVVCGVVALAYAVLLGAWFRACDDHACPSTQSLGRLPLHQTSTILASDGTVLAEVGSERRAFVPLDQMAPVLKQAFLVTEDRRFYRHDGVDYLRVLGAMGNNLASGRLSEGGSTITMQLARNLWPENIDGRSRTFSRKLREIQVAYRIEKRFSKNKILELYLNQIPLGGQVFGVEPASRAFFGKSASQVNVATSRCRCSSRSWSTIWAPRELRSRFPRAS